MNDNEKFRKSLTMLKRALKKLPGALEDPVLAAGIAKCFEVCFEYAWKHLGHAR